MGPFIGVANSVELLGDERFWNAMRVTPVYMLGAVPLQIGVHPELEPLPTIDELRERWNVEWAAVDGWLPGVTDGFVGSAGLADAAARHQSREAAPG